MRFEDFDRQLDQHKSEIPPGFVRCSDNRNADGKLMVDETFSTQGGCMPWFPGHPEFPTPESVLEEFDKPEELMVIRTGVGYGIVRKTHLPHLRRRERIANQVLEEHGILSLEGISVLDIKEAMELRREIEERMERDE